MGIVELIWRYRLALLDGLGVTLQLCLIVWSVGIAIGVVVGTIAARWPLIAGWPTRVAAAVVSAVPVIVLLFWLHYPAQMVLGIVIDPFITACVALTLVNLALVADLVRGAVLELPRQYKLAAQACGLSQSDTFLFVTAPLLLRQLLPAVLAIQVAMLQASLFASLISVNELFRVVQRINSEVYRPVEIYSGLAFFFLAVCVPLNLLTAHLRNRFTRDVSEV